MRYSKVYIDSIGYELPPVVVSTKELEDRLTPVYQKLRISKGQLQAMTGIRERRWWEPNYRVSDGAIAAGHKALENSNVSPDDIGTLIYAAVCREGFEPATACRVAEGLNIGEDALVYDLSNACLGVLNGIIEIANQIELGQIKAGMVVSCESAREINDIMIARMINDPRMELFITSIATLTGGSGGVAVILTDGSFGNSQAKKIVGGISKAAPEYNNLCRWYPDKEIGFENMTTDSVSVLKYGVALGAKTWEAFLKEISWQSDDVDKTICHQVGSGHQDTVLKTIGVPKEKDYSTYPYLGNIGTVSLPITAAIADERGFLESGDKVAFLGIGSGLNCMMLGVEW
ncbi:MAG: 3-oxoacyl-ACP synthase III [Nitrospinota bacterium]|nr:3-oxoacyl-ACP synthase III [Nitrospinota bacterium]